MSPRLAAHRGLRTQFPENTALAIRSAIEAGVWGVEFDLELTKDKKLVVLHQETLELNEEKTGIRLAKEDPMRDWTSQMMASDLMQLDAGAWVDQKYLGERVPSFDALLEFDWQETVRCIELKDPLQWDRDRSKEDELRSSRIYASAFAKALPTPGKRDFVLSFAPGIHRCVRELLPESQLVLNLLSDAGESKSEIQALHEEVSLHAIDLPISLLAEDSSWREFADSLECELWSYQNFAMRGVNSFSDEVLSSADVLIVDDPIGVAANMEQVGDDESL